MSTVLLTQDLHASSAGITNASSGNRPHYCVHAMEISGLAGTYPNGHLSLALTTLHGARIATARQLQEPYGWTPSNRRGCYCIYRSERCLPWRLDDRHHRRLLPDAPRPHSPIRLYRGSTLITRAYVGAVQLVDILVGTSVTPPPMANAWDAFKALPEARGIQFLASPNLEDLYEASPAEGTLTEAHPTAILTDSNFGFERIRAIEPSARVLIDRGSLPSNARQFMELLPAGTPGPSTC